MLTYMNDYLSHDKGFTVQQATTGTRSCMAAPPPSAFRPRQLQARRFHGVLACMGPPLLELRGAGVIML